MSVPWPFKIENRNPILFLVQLYETTSLLPKVHIYLKMFRTGMDDNALHRLNELPNFSTQLALLDRIITENKKLARSARKKKR